MSKRFPTKYPGVFFRLAKRAGGGEEKVYYVVFRIGRDLFEEKVGRQFQDDMTPARAARVRAERMEGKRKSRKELRADEEAERQRMTLGRIWEEFRLAKQDNKSLRDDVYRWRKHLETDFGSKLPADLVTLDVDRLKRKLKKAELAPATQKQVLVLLRRILFFGARRGLCAPPDPTRLVFELPKVNNTTTEDLNPEQLSALLDAIEAEPNRQAAHLMLMALYTGMRRSELFRLQWGHVDFERGFILIKDPKGGQDAKIPLNDAARDLLTRHPKTGSVYVFPGRGGNQRTDIRHQVARIKRRAGLPDDFRPLHGLRHVYASMLASSGKVDLYTLQKLLTHKSAAMTMRYAHLQDEALKRASAVASGFFDSLGQDQGEEKVVNLEEHRNGK